MAAQINYSGAPIQLGAINKLLTSGLDDLTGATKSFSDRIQTRARNTAINDLLGIQPTVGNGETSVGQSPLQFQQQQQSKLAQIQGIDPLQALGLATKQAQPYQAEAKRIADADALKFTQGIQTDTLDERVRNNQAVENKVTAKGFGAITDEFGTTYIYNKDSGGYEPIVNANANGGSVPPKFIKTVQVKNRDGLGRETTENVSIDTRTGEAINPEQSVTGSIAPTLTQKDKDFTKLYGQGSTTISGVRDTLKDSGLWGGLDALTGPIGAFLNTDEGNRQSLLNQDLENLRLEATNKLAGVLSNQDMQIILDTIPTVSDQPEVAEKKLAKVEKAMAKADANNFNRLAQSNPEAVQKMGQAMFNDEAPEPFGYEIEYEPNLKQYRLIRK